MKIYRISTPIGHLTLHANENALFQINFTLENQAFSPLSHSSETALISEKSQSPLLLQAAREIQEYFAGKRTVFTVPLAPVGTPFQKRVWEELLRVPYGKTVSYSEIARRLNSPNGARAVGMANHQNPIPILIPCHRVIGANGKLTGYAGGLKIKKFLLELEKNAQFTHSNANASTSHEIFDSRPRGN